MNRIFFIIAAVVVVIGIAVTVWIDPDLAGAPDTIVPTVTAPQEFDTTGGQEMRPRWGAQEEQGQ